MRGMINVYQERGLDALHGIVVAVRSGELMIVYHDAQTDPLWICSHLFDEKDMFLTEDGQVDGFVENGESL